MGGNLYKEIVIIVLFKYSAMLLARKKLLSFNKEGIITLPRPYISPLMTLMHVLRLPDLRLALIIIPVYIFPAYLIRLLYSLTIS